MEIKVGDYYFYDGFFGFQYVEKIVAIDNDKVSYSYFTESMEKIKYTSCHLETYERDTTFKIHPILVKLYGLDKLFENK